MDPSGVHILTTLRCTFECDHCFVWGSPRQSATMPLAKILDVIEQAAEIGSVGEVFFEGGEPFLHFAVLRLAVERAADMGFEVGVVSNGYWATDADDARACLWPLAGAVRDLTLSSDLYHFDRPQAPCTTHAAGAARALGIPVSVVSIAQPDGCAPAAHGTPPAGESAVMFRGRAAAVLADGVAGRPWAEHDRCPHEDLEHPERVHVDPFGHVHVCQGISIGNLFETPLAEICRTYLPKAHPIVGPLLDGGPAGLLRRYDLQPRERYADPCHACYDARLRLRERFPVELAPPELYGAVDGV